MTLTVAIHPDNETNPALGSGHPDASSPIWEQCLRDAGIAVKQVDVFANDILDQLSGCNGLMWRRLHNPKHHAVAQRLLPVAEKQLGMCVYPDWNTAWHYDDKIAQHYLLHAANIPTPQTWVFYERSKAEAFLQEAAYPLVLKLSAGAGSTNVRLLHDAQEALQWTKHLFEEGVRSLDALPKASLSGAWERSRDAARYALTGEHPYPGNHFELHKNYLLIQAFLPDNAFDTRVTVVGDRAFAYRRFNRPNDFRASGSGNFSPDPSEIDEQAIRLAFHTARTLGLQSVAIDGLRDLARDNAFVVGEISYTYVSWMVHACPGHWTLQNNDLRWVAGSMYPEQAQAEDFIQRLKQRAASLAPDTPLRSAA